MSPWDSDIKKLASCENVSCKISGLVTEADWYNWNVEDFTPYMEVVLEAFGSHRLTIGSDWPVCTLAGQYNSVMSIATDFITRLSDNEQKAYKQGVKRVSICKPGYRSKQRQQIEKEQWFKNLQRFRAGIEGIISALMRGYGLKRCLWKGWQSFKSYVGLSIVTFNLQKIADHT